MSHKPKRHLHFSARPDDPLPDKPTRWILCYDIRNPRRLQRVHRYVSKHGLPMQYSVFLLKGSREKVERILAGLRPYLDERVDDVRCYPLGKSTRIWGLGQQFSDGPALVTDEMLDRLVTKDETRVR